MYKAPPTHQDIHSHAHLSPLGSAVLAIISTLRGLTVFANIFSFNHSLLNIYYKPTPFHTQFLGLKFQRTGQSPVQKEYRKTGCVCSDKKEHKDEGDYRWVNCILSAEPMSQMDATHAQTWAGSVTCVSGMLGVAEFNILILKRQFKKEQSAPIHPPPPFFFLFPTFHFLPVVS